MSSNSKFPPSVVTTAQTDEEKKNLEVVMEYMRIAYSPKENKGRKSVEHLCTSDSKFIAPTTFPDAHTPMDYADSHSKVMACVSDLHIKQFDIAFAKGNHVCLRYSAEGSHCGESHNGIEPTGNKASWTAAALFEVRDGKVYSFHKDWDKRTMWDQLGWLKNGEYA